MNPFDPPPIAPSEMTRAMRVIGPQHIGCRCDGRPHKQDCRRALAAWAWAAKEAARRTAETN